MKKGCGVKIFIFNGGWAVLETLDSFIYSFINKKGKIIQVLLEHAHPTFLTA